ncbi:integral membrane protein [Aspergillus sclerotialis]|uniref:Integral membrane protein n=1 Tax=Aspergillus sclerotialis TaxID=2070753 RepID=A0A3A2ZV10_9EURO|nr:integral membrane protein [Aspergillus sclerotialis]
MWQKTSRAAFAAAWLLVSAANALPHGDDDSMDMDKDMNMDSHSGQDQASEAFQNSPMSYFAYGKHSGTIVAHIALMVLAWCFVLPIAVMFSVARSRFALLSQFGFLVFNALGLLLGIIYNSQTPDLYENNAHHKIGWIVTWVACAQTIMSLIFVYAGRGEPQSNSYERTAFLPVATEDSDHQHTYPNGAFHDYRWSRDSGQGTERNSASLNSRLQSPTCESPVDDFDGFEKPEDQVHVQSTGRPSWWQNTVIDRFLVSRLPSMVSSRVLRILNAVYIFIDKIILPFGFLAMSTGGVTYGGIMRGHEIFNGLAHFIKGGIFFWYGVLTFGRWLGCCADLGWAWNIKPTSDIVGKWKARVPSGEFTESFVIFLYGSTNVFLEHLAGWGKEWSPMDLEHVSISILFFGGGLCGMLFESKRIKDTLNRTILPQPTRYAIRRNPDSAWEAPNTQNVSLNPMPALVILLLGMMMGSHHQDSMTSTMVHKQWGNLLVGFALARGATYILLYIKPPTSYLPARPPTEVISGFCLIAGGLIFMLSTRNIVDAMIVYEVDAMFTFTVGMGFTAFVMALEVVAIAVKAWAVKRELPPQPEPFRFPA